MPKTLTHPILLSGGRVACLVVPWPLCPADHELLVWQVANALETVRRVNAPRWACEAEAAPAVDPAVAP